MRGALCLWPGLCGEGQGELVRRGIAALADNAASGMGIHRGQDYRTRKLKARSNSQRALLPVQMRYN